MPPLLPIERMIVHGIMGIMIRGGDDDVAFLLLVVYELFPSWELSGWKMHVKLERLHSKCGEEEEEDTHDPMLTGPENFR